MSDPGPPSLKRPASPGGSPERKRVHISERLAWSPSSQIVKSTFAITRAPVAAILQFWEKHSSSISMAKPVGGSSYEYVAAAKQDSDLRGSIFKQYPVRLFTANCDHRNIIIPTRTYHELPASLDFPAPHLNLDILKLSQIHTFPFPVSDDHLPPALPVLFTRVRKHPIKAVETVNKARDVNDVQGPTLYSLPTHCIEDEDDSITDAYRLFQRYCKAIGWGQDVSDESKSAFPMLVEAQRLLGLITTLREQVPTTFTSLESATEMAIILANGTDLMLAFVRVIRRLALDLCAVLGHAELPVWPARDTLRGGFVPCSASERPSSPDLGLVAAAERWGLPLYMVRTSEYNRLEYGTADLYPVSTTLDIERAHQTRLGKVLESRGSDPIPVLYVVEHHSAHWGGHKHFSETSLDDLIFRLLESGEPNALPFDEFSREMGELVGDLMWNHCAPPRHTYIIADNVRWKLHVPHVIERTLQVLPSDLPVPPIPTSHWVGLEVTDETGTNYTASPYHDDARYSADAWAYRDGKLVYWVKLEKALEDLMTKLCDGFPRANILRVETNDAQLADSWHAVRDLDYIRLAYSVPSTGRLREKLRAHGSPSYLNKVEGQSMEAHVIAVHYHRQRALFCYQRIRRRLKLQMQRPRPPPALPVGHVAGYSFTPEFLRMCTEGDRPTKLSSSEWALLLRTETIVRLLATADFEIPITSDIASKFRVILSYVGSCVTEHQSSTDGLCEVLDDDQACESLNWSVSSNRLTLHLCRHGCAPRSPITTNKWLDHHSRAETLAIQEVDGPSSDSTSERGSESEGKDD